MGQVFSLPLCCKQFTCSRSLSAKPALADKAIVGGSRTAIRRRSRESGSVVVEFALSLLPFLALLFMTLDLAWIFFGWSCIQEGAREGVRYAVTGSGQAEASLNDSIKQVVQQYSFGFAKASNIRVDYYLSTGYSASGLPGTVDGAVGATAAGNVVKVSVQNVSIGTFGPIFRSATPLPLSASSSDVMQ
jgi:Flp pilus assembly protein TadG